MSEEWIKLRPILKKDAELIKKTWIEANNACGADAHERMTNPRRASMMMNRRKKAKLDYWKYEDVYGRMIIGFVNKNNLDFIRGRFAAFVIKEDHKHRTKPTPLKYARILSRFTKRMIKRYGKKVVMYRSKTLRSQWPQNSQRIGEIWFNELPDLPDVVKTVTQIDDDITIYTWERTDL